MESSQGLFTREYSSSEDVQPDSFRFNVEDLPNLSIPSPFHSDRSECETPNSPFSQTASRPTIPTTPLSSGSSLGGEFYYFNIPSQTSEGATPSTPKITRGKNYVKKPSYNFKKAKGRQRPGCVPESP